MVDKEYWPPNTSNHEEYKNSEDSAVRLGHISIITVLDMWLILSWCLQITFSGFLQVLENEKLLKINDECQF